MNGIVAKIPDSYMKFLTNVPDAIVVFLIFCVIAIIIDLIIKKIESRFDADTGEIFRIISNSQKGLFLFVGFIVSITTLGFNLSALITGLGLTGFALGFALKDALSNFLAGVMIGLYKPCRIGDNVEIVGSTGLVIDINLRYITLEGEKGKFLIPNSLVIKNKMLILNKIDSAKIN